MRACMGKGGGRGGRGASYRRQRGGGEGRQEEGREEGRGAVIPLETSESEGEEERGWIWKESATTSLCLPGTRPLEENPRACVRARPKV